MAYHMLPIVMQEKPSSGNIREDQNPLRLIPRIFEQIEVAPDPSWIRFSRVKHVTTADYLSERRGAIFRLYERCFQIVAESVGNK